MGQTYPLPVPVASLVLANPRAGYPRYTAMNDWLGGAVGDDKNEATATVVEVDASGGAAIPDYSPRTQADKAATLGTGVANDISRPRGYIAPGQPYGPVPAAPVVASISPTTAPQAQLPLLVTITGTGFTVWSTVKTGGMKVPDASAKFVNSTTMTVPIWAAAPGTVSVVVEDHDVNSNSNVLFTVT